MLKLREIAVGCVTVWDPHWANICVDGIFGRRRIRCARIKSFDVVFVIREEESLDDMDLLMFIMEVLYSSLWFTIRIIVLSSFHLNANIKAQHSTSENLNSTRKMLHVTYVGATET